MAIPFKTDSGDFGVLNITGTTPADFRPGINSSGDNYLERAYITGSDGSWIKLDNSVDAWEVDGSKVYYTGGNVGIGTLNPASNAKLEVVGNICLTGGRLGVKTLQPQSAAEIYGTLSLNTSGQTRGLWFGSGIQALGYIGASDYAINGLSTVDFGISSATDELDLTGCVAFGIGGAEKMRIDTFGNVGIGTGNPSTSLNIATSSNDDGILLQNSDYPTARLFNDGTNAIGRLALYHSGDAYLNLSRTVSYSSGMQLGLGHTAEFINRMGETKATLDVQCAAVGHTGVQVMNAAYNRRVFYVTNEGNAYLGLGDDGLAASGLSVTSGRVGIGTTAPSVALDVAGNLRAIQGTAGGASVFTNFQGVGGDTTGSQIRLMDSNGAVPITLNSNGVSSITGGSVGIGTNSPLDYDGESDDLVVYSATHGGITIATADTTARGNLRFADGLVGAEAYRGAVEYDHNSDTLSFRASGVSTMFLQSGIVGIGTSSPSSHSDLTLANFGSLCLKETTTPTSDTNFGKLYTKSDNSLYFQDGAGTESVISLGGGSSWSSAPATATSAGAAGDRAYDSNYYYVCVATNTWKRTSLATW